MKGTFLDDERYVDLLIQEATAGLNEAEAAELDELLAHYPDARRSESTRLNSSHPRLSRMPSSA